MNQTSSGTNEDDNLQMMTSPDDITWFPVSLTLRQKLDAAAATDVLLLRLYHLMFKLST